MSFLKYAKRFSSTTPVKYTRNIFLRAVCVVYLFAFISFYVQIPGLYGDNGVLPAKSVLENSKHKTLSTKVHYQPTLLWLAPYLGLDTNYALDVLALLGAFLAFSGFVSYKICRLPLFGGLWSLYFSLYQVGQVFVTSQWDDLLLEVGFLCLLIAPILRVRNSGGKQSPIDPVVFWLPLWLLFRFLFTTGVVKLLSGDPKWWDLSALGYHFQGMVLPTPLSWYAHHLPEVALKYAMLYANICEIAFPFLFFVPIRSTRYIAFAAQGVLQFFIIITGNFSFLNALILALMISLFDDYYFIGEPKGKNSKGLTALSFVIFTCTLLGITTLCTFPGKGYIPTFTFSKEEFKMASFFMVKASYYIGFLTLAILMLKSFVASFLDGNFMSRILRWICAFLYAALAFLVFSASLVPLYSHHPTTNNTLSEQVRTAFKRLHKIHAINAYGQAKSVTGTDGRPEIVLEGSNHLEGPWTEYDFLYKPGNVNHSLPFVAPHSPRLDWQMWSAAHSTYEKQPWLLSLTHRLLEGRPEVLALMGSSPFEKPPKFIRATLYKYKFSDWTQRKTQTWWVRERVREYFPAFTKDSPTLVDYLRARNLMPTASKQPVNPLWKQGLDAIRKSTVQLEASLLIWAAFTAGCAVITIR